MLPLYQTQNSNTPKYPRSGKGSGEDGWIRLSENMAWELGGSNSLSGACICHFFSNPG